MGEFNNLKLNDADEKEIFVGLHLTTDQRVKEAEKTFTNVFVKNFPENLDEKKLREMFAIHGEVESVKIETDENNVSKCHGFVSMKTHAAADSAVTALHGTKIGEK